MRMVIAAALIAASATPASAYVRHPYAAAHYAYHGGVAHPYAAARVVRGAAVGAAVVGAAAAGDYYNGYSQPYYDSGDTYSYGTAYNTGYGGHVLGCGIGNWRCNAAASGYAQPYYNGGDTYSYGSYGTSYTPRGYYATTLTTAPATATPATMRLPLATAVMSLAAVSATGAAGEIIEPNSRDQQMLGAGPARMLAPSRERASLSASVTAS